MNLDKGDVFGYVTVVRKHDDFHLLAHLNDIIATFLNPNLFVGPRVLFTGAANSHLFANHGYGAHVVRLNHHGWVGMSWRNHIVK